MLLCSGFPTQLALGGLIRLGGLSPITPSGDLSARFVFLLSFADAALLISLIVWLLQRRGERPAEVFFGGRPLLRELGVGVRLVPLILLAVYGMLIIVRLVAPWLHNVPENPLESMVNSPLGLAAFLVVVVVAGGIREELQRAFLLHRFKHDLGGGAVGLAITSMAFGLGHALQGWDAVLVTGMLGAVWGWMYLSRGSAAASIGSHAAFNTLELVRAFVGRAVA